MDCTSKKSNGSPGEIPPENKKDQELGPPCKGKGEFEPSTPSQPPWNGGSVLALMILVIAFFGFLAFLSGNPQLLPQILKIFMELFS